jgi:ferritin-like metal-binding protein YciE
MADETPTRDAKLIQYLNEAYGKERELETALQAHIKMATGRAAYKKRLQDHLKETKAQARGLERRIKQLGGKAEAANLPGPDVAAEAASRVTAAATKAMAAAKGPIHALRGTGEAEKLLKNAKTELWNEYEEIGNYVAIETVAQAVGDKDTEKLAREFRRQEERMAGFLSKLIPQLAKAVVTEEIPAAERRKNGTRRRASSRSRSRTASSSRSGAARASSSRSSSSRSTGSRASSSGSRSTGSRASSSGSRSTSSGSRSTGSRSSSTGSRSASSRRSSRSRGS